MKHIILISLDNLRYDCIGYQPDKKELLRYDVLKYLETPTLDEIAGEGICFTQCISTGTYTTATHASALTGLYPPRHGVRAFYETKLHKDVYTLAEILKVFGYKTIMATDTPVNFLPLNLNKGFDHVLGHHDFNVIKFVEENKDEKIFLFVHFFDIHTPFLMSKHKAYDNIDYFSTMETLYERFNIKFPADVTDGWLIWARLGEHIGRRIDVLFPLYVRGVSKFDKGRLKVFIDDIKKLNLLSDGLLMIFSDHGEGKMYKDRPEFFGHGVYVFDNVIRVPLIVYHKDLPHKVLDELVSHVDIFPTVIELALGKNVKDLLPYNINGQSLFTSEERKEVYCETYRANNRIDYPWSQLSFALHQRAIRTKKEKFVLYGEPEWPSRVAIDKMDNKEFLKSVYRKLMCKFEDYDDYMKNLNMLDRGEISKRDFLSRYGSERFEIYDLKKDPYEENPLAESIDPATLSSYRARLLELSSPAVQSEDIFVPLDEDLVERMTENLFLDEFKESLNAIIENKNLFNKLIGKFLKRNKDVPDEEFVKKCCGIFFDREPEGENFDQLMNLIQEGVPRDTVFMAKIFQLLEKHEFVSKNDQIRELQAESSDKSRIIDELNSKLARANATLDMICNSKTWRIGQLYGKIVNHIKINKFLEVLGNKIISKKNDTPLSADERLSEDGVSLKPQDKVRKIESLPLEIILMTNFECVYNCSYCFSYKPRNKNEYRKYSAAEWESVFLSFYQKYGKCNLVLSGGEPFFYKDSVDFVINTTKYHYVHAGTNLFLEKDLLKRIAIKSNRENLYISASFHLERANIETFIEKMLLLKDYGVNVRANAVLYPKYLGQMIEIKNKFEEASIQIGFFPYIGEYEGRKFPDEYLEQELKIIRELPVWHQSQVWSKSHQGFQIQLPRTKGILCYAGVKTIYINPMGEVRRCMPMNKIMGNVFEKGFSLLEKPEPCPFEICDCGLYWKYHLK